MTVCSISDCSGFAAFFSPLQLQMESLDVQLHQTSNLKMLPFEQRSDILKTKPMLLKNDPGKNHSDKRPVSFSLVTDYTD